MTNSKESRFQAKLIYFIVFVLFLKFVYLIITSIVYRDFPSFLGGLVILALVFFILSYFINSLFNGIIPSGSGVGGSSTVGDRQFQTLMERYEKLTNEFIEKKQYKKAAYIQLKLLRNSYRAASILKEGHLYNEAAHIYLKKCHRKQEAAECYEMARSYTKSIKLYKELEMNEKVGDIYAKIEDTKNAQAHYQMVVDAYSKNSQFVKGSLIYRKKMDNIPSANALLLQGWTENKDAVNCANNYFANFKDKASLEKAIIDFKNKNVHNGNEYNFLKTLMYEYNKDIVSKEDIQLMAYE
ncbi:MAG: hypothetical protein AB8B65_18820, partial [Kordia sp.]|uniref:hypothetical protein n=1 Tax=Kordia sp. TaxID=1965332 RepID=UPI00385A22F5